MPNNLLYEPLGVSLVTLSSHFPNISPLLVLIIRPDEGNLQPWEEPRIDLIRPPHRNYKPLYVLADTQQTLPHLDVQMIGYFFRGVDLGYALNQFDVLDEKLESVFDVVVCTGYGNVVEAGDYGWYLGGGVAGGLGGRENRIAARRVEMPFGNSDGQGFFIGIASLFGSGCSFGNVDDLVFEEKRLLRVSISYFISGITVRLLQILLQPCSYRCSGPDCRE
jgi:hypothetical protein